MAPDEQVGALPTRGDLAMRPTALIAAALAAVFAVSCAQFREKVSSRPASTTQASDDARVSGTGARTAGDTPLAAGGAGGNGGSTGSRY